ncbi:hypothetical protein FPHYL_852 [Fusarium phyllophilum]|uniref:Uncharacterized protein n=1 Tax=Fusarium phyllophilum TaxID=47803 RepID=A0A8H5NLH8_9HYPO|nr:hypothetical protein FPHYL_852 [Fusarium phyllophilum]
MRFCIPPNTWTGTRNESIDTSNDLIIVCRLPRTPTTSTQFGAVESIGVPYEYNPLNEILQWYPLVPVGLNRDPLDYATDFLQRFPRLRVLYIIVKPQDISAPQFTEYMTNYHWDYTQTVNQVPPKTFNARQRIYYEVPERMCRGLISTYQRVKDASVASRDGTDLPPLVIRVMTWKQAPGVRGRFDH